MQNSELRNRYRIRMSMALRISLLTLFLSICSCSQKGVSTNPPKNQTGTRLAFFLPVNPSAPGSLDLAELRAEFLAKGRSGLAPEEGLQWVQLMDIDTWGYGERLVQLKGNPSTAFQTLGLVVETLGDDYYVLVNTSAGSWLEWSTKGDWRVRSVSATEDQLGFPCIRIVLDETGNAEFETLVSKLQGSPLVAAVDGKIVSARRGPPWIGPYSFSKAAKAEVAALLKQLQNAKPGAGKHF